jgi:hypothetical protein
MMLKRGPQVGQRANDAETRSAVGAVREGVAVVTVCRFVNLPQAIRADGEIGQDQRGFRAPLRAVADLEVALAKCGRGLPVEVMNCRVCGQFLPQSDEERIETERRRFNLDQHALW